MSKKYKNFFILEEVPNAPPYIFSLADAMLVNPFFKKIHKLNATPGDDLNIYEDDALKIYYNTDVVQKCAQGIFNKIIDDPQWGIDLDDRIYKTSTNFIAYSKSLHKKEIQHLSNKELVKASDEWFFKYFADSWISGWPSVLVDFDRNLFSNYLLGYLKQKIEHKKLALSVGDVFSVLTTPLEDSFAQKEAVSLFKLLNSIKKNRGLVQLLTKHDSRHILDKWPNLDTATWRAFNRHYELYCWLPFMYTGPAWEKEYFIESITSLLRQNVDPELELKRIKQKKEETKILQKKYIKNIGIHDKHAVLFDIARRFVFLKSLRKDAMYYSCYVLQFLIKEIARRTFFSLRQAYRIYPWEIKDVLHGRGPNAHTLNKRIGIAVQFSTTKSRKTFEGDSARKFLKQVQFIRQTQQKPHELLGDCACPGKVRGVVKIINTPKDMEKMKQGNVLISYATSPDIVPAIKKASSIVTDLGGITCHAAIISRELRIPCVVGTKIASTLFKDGDVVEVDANHGIVRKIK